MSLKEAREAARSLRALIKAGADPIAERRRARALVEVARRGEGTLRALLDAYERDAACFLRSWSHSRLRIERVFSGLP